MPAKKTRKPRAIKHFVVMVREIHIQPVRVEASSKNAAVMKVAAGEGVILSSQREFSKACAASSWTVKEENSPCQTVNWWVQ